MVCSRCGKEIPDEETICPFCFEIINEDLEFNNYKKDGFVALRKKENPADTTAKHTAPKYFNMTEMNIFVVAIVFVLVVSVATLFGLNLLQNLTEAKIMETIKPVTVYVTKETVAPTEPPIKNALKNVSIKNLYGSWKYKDNKETPNAAIPYFSFIRGGIVQVNLGSVEYTGEFEDVSQGKKHNIFINIDSFFKGTYKFVVKGNEDDGYRLTLTHQSGNKLEFESATAKTNNLTAIPNNKVDKELIGLWLNKNGDKSYKFTSDGRMVRTMDNMTLNCVWTIYDKGVITVKYMRYLVESENLNYKIVNDQLIINDTIYYKQ